MASTTIDNRGSVDSSSGTGLTVSVASTFASTVNMTATPTTTVQALAASASISNPGVYTLGNATPSGYTLPTPASVPGGVFSFRITTAQAHFLTGSAADTLGKFMTDGTNNGSKLTFASPAVGNSLTLISDGLNFCVMARSGSAGTFAGT